MSLDELKAEVEAALKGEIVSVNVFQSEDRSVQFGVKTEGAERPVTYFVNPYSGKFSQITLRKQELKNLWVTSFRFTVGCFWIRSRNRSSNPRPIWSWVDLSMVWRLYFFLLGVITGIFIWFPQKVKNWKQGLKIKWSGNWKRVNHDLHNTLAFYSLIFLLIMAVTGPFWSYQWYKEGWQKKPGTFIRHLFRVEIKARNLSKSQQK